MAPQQPQQIAIIGAGIGGLTAALLLAHAGLPVTVFESAGSPGGKLREITLGTARIDAGPTVFTLKPIFDAIFAAAGARLEDHLALETLDILARHHWEDGAELDLVANTARNAAAIGAYAGPSAAQGYIAFARRARMIFETLDDSFMQTTQPGLFGLLKNAGPTKAASMMQISPFATLWDELGRYFANPRLRQLFGRYATYCGSSPFSAPATLMLIAHAEQMGVWRVKGGMKQLAFAIANLAQARGATFRYNAAVDDILVRNGQVAALRLADGEIIQARAVIANAELAALATGQLGPAAKAVTAGLAGGAKPSLSALTWAISGTTAGTPLAHHNVFFSSNYQREFAELAAGHLPSDPTIYLCAAAPGEFFCLVNAPPTGENGATSEMEEQECLSRMLAKLRRHGLTLAPRQIIGTGPAQFAKLFPASNGALYGRALTSWRDPFARPGARTKLPGLYLAGGGVHPGPGLPMAATSGRLAAQALLADLTSARKFHPAAMPGGISTRSAMTVKAP